MAKYFPGDGTSTASFARVIQWIVTFLSKFPSKVADQKVLRVAGGSRYC
ncbi:hypothetical protein NC652_016136 [Populus alba x Populus x berolinensis]|nr:hypothetical protein NC652_016136 [Populus alba x Populus x berolinensis]